MNDNKKVRKGICRNYGECDKAVPGEIIEVEAGQPFTCPECNEPLTEVDDDGNIIRSQTTGGPGGGNNKTKIILCIIGAAIIAVIIVILCLMRRTPSEQPQSGPTPTDTISEPKQEPIDSTEVSIGKPQTTKEDESQKVKDSNSNTSVPVTPKSTTNKLSYGTWKGSMKNGKPHGQGTMTYSIEKLIDARDSKGRVAQPNEYIIGEWDNGNLVQGRWFKNDGSKEVIIIGKAG